MFPSGPTALPTLLIPLFCLSCASGPAPARGPANTPGATTRDLPALSSGRHSTRTIPGGLACLLRLRKLGISHTAAGPLPEVLTPVRITGPIGGVHYRPQYRTPMLCDCRMALALHRAGPHLRALGVDALLYSSVYRRTRIRGTRRLSRHAYGLAMDVHRVVAAGQSLSVSEQYRTGMGDRCAADAPLLNRVACVLKRRGLFDRVLTPDYDAAHHNHFHLALLSLHRRPRGPAPNVPPGPDTD